MAQKLMDVNNKLLSVGHFSWIQGKMKNVLKRHFSIRYFPCKLECFVFLPFIFSYIPRAAKISHNVTTTTC